MKTHSRRIAATVLWGSLAFAVRAGAAEPNVVRAIDVADRDGALELSIEASRPPSYTVFKLQDPPRLVVDLAGGDVSQVSSPVEVGRSGVIAVSTAQYKDERSAVGRVIVALEGPRRYEVAPRGSAVVVKVFDKGSDAKGTRTATPKADASVAPKADASVATAAARPLTPTVSPAGAGEREKTEQTVSSAGGREKTEQTVSSAGAREKTEQTVYSAGAGEIEKDGAAAAADVARPERDKSDHVVSRRLDEARVALPARAITSVKTSRDRVLLATDRGVGTMEIIELRDPPRLAVDLHGVTRAPRQPVKTSGAFTQVRFGKDEGKTRVVLDAAGELSGYEVRRVKGGVAIIARTANPKPTGAVAKTPTPSPDEPAAAEAAPSRTRIGDVRFAQQGGFARIEIAGKARHTISRPDERTVVLSLEAAELPKKLERSLDTAAFRGPVMMVSSFNQPTSGDVKIVATLRGKAVDQIAETPRGLAWTFQSVAGGSEKPDGGETVVTMSDAASAGFAAEAPSYALSGAPQARGYKGRRITLDFHDIEIRNLLRLIADVSKKNIVVADDVTGKVTVALRNVPWDQALDLILKAKGLGKEEMGNVIRVAKLEQITKEQQARAEAEKARAPTLPLKVRIIPVNFARAEDVAGRVKDVLSERGTVSTDQRTNVLIVKDVAEALVRAEGLVRNLDTEIPQVLIESRIVEASSNFNKALGVQWGGNAAFSQATGNPTGLSFPNNVVATGGAGPGTSFGTAPTPNFAVSLPAPVGEGAGGAIGLILGSAGGAFNLNLRLSALENTGVVKTISAPKIATIDNREATIGQGISIPFSQVSASGVNTMFIEAKLELKVTPHVSADGSILLKIKATNNQPNPQLTGANGQPSISKREAETEVLVKDGDTTVIGGIYTRQTANKRAEVPFLSNIPLLGALFRFKSDTDDHTELLIFITPRILNRSATTTVAAGTK